MHNNK